MDVGAGLLHVVRQLIQLVVDWIDIEAFHRQLLGGFTKTMKRPIHLRNRRVEVSRTRAAVGIVLRILIVAFVARRSRARLEQTVVRPRDAVISVTLSALRPVVFFERLLVLAAVKQTRIAGVTKTATLIDAGESGRHRRMMSVTIVARRCGEIPALQNRAAVDANTVFRQLVGWHRRTVRSFEAGHGRRVRMARSASLRNALAVNQGERVFGVTDTVDAVATDTLRSTRVFGFKEPLAVWTVFEFRQLISGQRRIEILHEAGIRMATRTEKRNPIAIFVAASARPFLDKRMLELRIGRIAAMATRAGKAASEMNIVHEIAQVEMGGRFVGSAGKNKKRFRFLDFGIRVAEDAIVLQKHLHFLRAQRQSKKGTQVVRPRNDFGIRGRIEQLAEAIVEAIEIGALLRSDDWLAIGALRGEQVRELL